MGAVAMGSRAGVGSAEEIGSAVAGCAAAVSAGQIWEWLAEVADPEIPVISVLDLGIVRDVQLGADGAWVVTITPTYSGCPAMRVIADAVGAVLRGHGLAHVVLRTRLSPAWTTDWMSEAGKAKLAGYGIAPPAQQTIDTSGLRHGTGLAEAVRRGVRLPPPVACPLCGSSHTENTSPFGSTPCKALYKCLDCREPFDYFKCHRPQLPPAPYLL